MPHRLWAIGIVQHWRNLALSLRNRWNSLLWRGDTPLRLAEKFLDDAGIGGELRRPFLSPFQAAYREGAAEIECDRHRLVQPDRSVQQNGRGLQQRPVSGRR